LLHILTKIGFSFFFIIRLFISSRAHLLFDFHIKADALMEEKKEENGTKIGTTCKGIGPCYSTKASRLGLRVADLSNFEIFKKKVTKTLY
jgi:adenylosuccinate synthase